MTDRIQAIRGMNDILPEETPRWQFLEKQIQNCLLQYGYQEIRMPQVESTSLFKRTIGEFTDIVEKEMYTFADLNGDSITLRPEGTAGCVRACLEHGLLHNQQQKLWYIGPMFRHEKPQKGRYRQFSQFGVEAFGYAGTTIELEIIAMTARLWKLLGVNNHVQLHINTLGEPNERMEYRAVLVEYFKKHMDILDEDSKRRLDRNPLRILDSKNPQMQHMISRAPKMLDSLSEASRTHFDNLCKGLDLLGISYVINPTLVRGLDYYTHTVIEWVTDKLGSQSTVCAGGRYDRLVEQLGGSPTPAFGFALGMERILLLIEASGNEPSNNTMRAVYLIADTGIAMEKALMFSEKLRNQFPDLQVLLNTAGGGFKSQFKKADKSGADFALIFGQEEIENESVSVKNLRENEAQITVSYDKCIEFLGSIQKQ